jgi:predicted nucleic acid-binding protein
MERLGHLSEKHATGLIGELAGFRCSRVSIQPLLKEIWQLRSNFSAYDAAYVAIALGTKSTLITHDMRLANAASSLIKTQQLAPAS